MGLFHGLDDRSVHRRPRRSGQRRRERDAVRGRGRGAGLCIERQGALEERARRLCRDLHARRRRCAADPFTQRWSVWAAGYGGSQTTDGNTVLGSNNTRSSIGGVAVGADYRFSPNTLAGFALAGGGTNFSVNGLGSGRSDLFQAGAFVRHNVGAAYVTGALAYGWQDITTDRTVTVAGIDLLRAQFQCQRLFGARRGRLSFCDAVDGGWASRPMPPDSSITFDLPAYAEQAIAGANTFALTYASQERHRHAHGTRPAQRQIVRDARTASSPCAAAPHGRMISTPTARSRRRSRRCRAHPSSSTAPRMRRTRRSSPPRPR